MLLTCVYLPSSPPRYSSGVPVRPRTLFSGSPTKKETQTPTRCTKYYLHHFNLPSTALFDHHIPSCSINLLVTHLPVCVWPILWQAVLKFITYKTISIQLYSSVLIHFNNSIVASKSFLVFLRSASHSFQGVAFLQHPINSSRDIYGKD